MGLIIQILLSAVAVYLSATLLPGVHVKSFWTAILVAIVLGLLNALVKPVLQFLSFPITILTLGLFLFVINTIIILICSYLVSSFQVNGFWSALLFSIVLSIITWLLNIVFNVGN